MYQPLMWGGVGLPFLRRVLGDQASGLRPPLHTQDLERAPDALVDGVGRNAQLGGDFLGRQMLIDQAQAIELARGQAGDAGCHFRIMLCRIIRSRHAVCHQTPPKCTIDPTIEPESPVT
jgi:hypothetical protein